MPDAHTDNPIANQMTRGRHIPMHMRAIYRVGGAKPEMIRSGETCVTTSPLFGDIYNFFKKNHQNFHN